MPYKLDFKQLAEEIDIEAVAKHLDLNVIKDRALCPVCKSDRSIQLFLETNTFRCHSAEMSGDCINLYAHITGTGMYQAAKALQGQFQTAQAAGQPVTPPQKPEGRNQPASKPPRQEQGFDRERFAKDLTYTDEVKALGISEDVAARFGIGFCSKPSMRGYVCFPVTDGIETHYIGWNGHEFKLPKWQSTVVPFSKKSA